MCLITVYSEKHKLHDPVEEFELGRFRPFQETPARVEHIIESIRTRNLGPVISPRDFGLAPVLKVHTLDYVDYMKTAYAAWTEIGGNPNGVFPDVFAVREFKMPNARSSEAGKSKFAYTPEGGPIGRPGYYCYDGTAVIADGTYEAAYDAAQVALTGAELLVNEMANGVFALCRPPGHHAHEDLCGGYCFFNNAAVATRHLIDVLKVGKVAILDIDYHHGNGSQAIFYHQSNPLYVSLHAALEYPYYTGSERETGEGEGTGYNVNIPLPLGTQDEEYVAALTDVLEKRIRPYSPDYIVVSLGVDTFKDDPVGGLFLTTENYTRIGQVIASLSCPALFVMEGGYAVAAIGENVVNVLMGFRDGFSS
ncbi:deacetylase [Fimicolochytrium jonesii]|uniref:deacetylase n=1 Tax=Fimicolochytrium jonesii TaxID=1396493 RepID=UPI0022FE7EFE|nr:deacetylase [Fimicolochytrium jonesii]KAI8818575.1 deacetylase [Fimicolochytrium jonesii]